MNIRLIITVASLLLSSASSAAWSAPVSEPAATAPIHQFFAAMNKGDMKTASAAFATDTVTIIDEFAPYVWQGNDAVARWGAAFMQDAAASGMQGPTLDLGRAIRVQVDGDTAYAVFPGTLRYSQKGHRMQEVAVMTFALAHTGDGWRIKAWSWGGHVPTAK